MRAEELRIGNYVYYNDKVISIAPNAINEFYYIGDTHSESLVDRRCYEPIELTEEILLKCGGILHGSEYIIKARALPIKIRFNSGIAYCEFGNIYLGDRIKHLHQLQNLYYALCNEELNIQL